MKSNTGKFAEQELDILVKNSEVDNRPIIENFIPEILALVDKFGCSGQSGGSAPFVASAISSAVNKLCLQEPINPIMGTDDEWADVAYVNDGKPLFQNKRCSGLFKYSNGMCSYVDAIVKKTPKGNTYSGSFWVNKKDFLSGDRNLQISNSQYVREFPFVPKTFYIDVLEEEVSIENWEMFLKDPSQLEEVFNYYLSPLETRQVITEKINTFLI